MIAAVSIFLAIVASVGAALGSRFFAKRAAAQVQEDLDNQPALKRRLISHRAPRIDTARCRVRLLATVIGQSRDATYECHLPCDKTIAWQIDQDGHGSLITILNYDAPLLTDVLVQQQGRSVELSHLRLATNNPVFNAAIQGTVRTTSGSVATPVRDQTVRHSDACSMFGIIKSAFLVMYVGNPYRRCPHALAGGTSQHGVVP